MCVWERVCVFYYVNNEKYKTRKQNVDHLIIKTSSKNKRWKLQNNLMKLTFSVKCAFQWYQQVTSVVKKPKKKEKHA